MQRDRAVDFIAAYITQGSRVLDVGSGRGGTAVEIALRKGCTLYGVDSSTWAVGRAKARARDKGVSNRVIFRRQRAENLDFPSGYFDLVYSIKALHETRHIEALNEMHRVLKEDDGRLIIIDWVKGSIAWTFERYFNLFELEEMVREAGFVTLKSEQEGDTLFLVAGKNV
jgi:ubiquinone/menaquinone biosynthesis C-methylase UbiE